MFMWAGDASSLFVIASSVAGQPLVAGYRWILGTLLQVNLDVEHAERDAIEQVESRVEEPRAVDKVVP
jgi:hypothetical protein